MVYTYSEIIAQIGNILIRDGRQANGNKNGLRLAYTLRAEKNQNFFNLISELKQNFGVMLSIESLNNIIAEIKPDMSRSRRSERLNGFLIGLKEDLGERVLFKQRLRYSRKGDGFRHTPRGLNSSIIVLYPNE